MIIGLDAKRALTNLTGLGQYARILINALGREFPDSSYVLFSPKVKEELLREVSANHVLVCPPPSLPRFLNSFWRTYSISEEIQTQSCELYHGLSNELPLNSHIRKEFKKVVTIHDLIFLKHKEQYTRIDRAIYMYKTAYAAKCADKIIAISEETKNDLIELLNVPEDKISVVYQSCSPVFFRKVSLEEKATLKKIYSLPDNFILNVSSFFPRKNHKAIIESLHLLTNKLDVHAVFIGGQGTIKNELEAIIKKYSLEKRVHFLSKVPDGDMPGIYQSAKAFVYPSFFEGFGIPILEAMASKLPVITTKGGCFEEAGGANTIYVNPKDYSSLAVAIELTLTNESHKEGMIRNGLAHLQTMTASTFARNTMNVYLETINKG